MQWFSETSWPPILIAVALAIGAFGLWRQNGRRVWLIAGLLLLALTPGLWLLERLWVTETEEVQQRLDELVAAVEADDVEAVLSFFEENLQAERMLVRTGMGMFRVQGPVRLTDMQIRRSEEDPARIRSHFRANGEVALKGIGGYRGHFTTRWEIDWKQTGGRWQIVRIQRLDPLTGKPVSLLSRR